MARSFRFKAIVAVAGLIVVVFGAFAGQGRLAAILPEPETPPANAQAERAPQPVRVTPVAFTVPTAIDTFTGTVRPQHEPQMAFRVPGKIVARLIDVGDQVAVGQVLARLDDTDARLTLQSAEAELTAARTDLSRASHEAKRSRDLFGAGHQAQAALDRAISAEAEALGRTDRALRARDQAANALSYTTLVADADGVVTAVLAEAGQVVAAGQAVATVAQTGALDVVFALPEQARGTLAGASATAALWEDDAHSYALTLRDVSPDVDPATRTYRVRMALTAPDAGVALGRTVTVTLTGPAQAPVVRLPLAAVLDTGQGASVWRVPAGGTHVDRVPVDIAALDGTTAALRGAFRDGDLVISLGAHRIDPARPVRVVETTPPPPN